MAIRKISLGIAMIAVLALAGVGCVHPHHGQRQQPEVARAHKHGPPPHAPAHGYRQKHQTHDVDLVFDSGLGVYVVIDLPDHFFIDGRFYRLSGGVWHMSSKLDDGWITISGGALPKGLHKGKHAKKHKHAHKKRGPGQAPASRHGY